MNTKLVEILEEAKRLALEAYAAGTLSPAAAEAVLGAERRTSREK